MAAEAADYGNWVSRKFVIVPGALGVAFAAGAVWCRWLVAPAGLFLLMSAYFSYARWAFSPTGRGLQDRMLELLLSQLPRMGESATVLDIGCGGGALTIRVARAHPEVHAVGIDRWGAGWGYSKRRCESNALAEGVAHRVSFQDADAVSLPFDKDTFDAVVSNFVFHEVHSVKDKRELLQEAFRVLKPGGVFAIQDLFLWERVYGPIDELVEALKRWGIATVEFVDTSQSDFIPKLLKLPFMVGTAGILYGRK